MTPGSELADAGDVEDGGAGFVGGGQIDLGADAPVVVTGRVVEDLAQLPDAFLPSGARVEDDKGRAAGVGAGADSL